MIEWQMWSDIWWPAGRKCHHGLYLQSGRTSYRTISWHDDVIKWKHFPRYWSFVRGIHRSPVNSPHKGQWRGALMFSLMCACTNGWVNNREAGNLRCHHAHYECNEVSKPRIGYYNNRIALQYDRHFGSTTAGVSVKFLCDWKRLYPNLAASRLHEILR